MTNKILFTLEVYFARSKSISSFPSIFLFLVKRSESSSFFIEASSEIGRKMKYFQAKQRIERVKTCKNHVIGRQITTILKIAVNHDVAAFTFAAWQITPEAPVIRFFAILRGFLTDLCD